MNSLMSMRTMASSSSNRNSASALHSSVLPTPVGPRNRNEPIGRLRVAQAGAAAADGVADGPHGLVLADHALAQPLLHLQQLLALALEHAATTGMPVHLLTTSAISSGVTSSLDQAVAVVRAARPASARASSSCRFSSRSSPYWMRAARSRSPRRWACSSSVCLALDLLLERLDLLEHALLVLPPRGQPRVLLLQLGQLLLDAAQAAACVAVVLLLPQGLALDLRAA